MCKFVCSNNTHLKCILSMMRNNGKKLAKIAVTFAKWTFFKCYQLFLFDNFYVCCNNCIQFLNCDYCVIISVKTHWICIALEWICEMGETTLLFVEAGKSIFEIDKQ